MFLGNDITEVTSYETSSPHPNFSRYEYPTSSVTILRYANGAIGKVASVVDSHQPYYLRVYLVGRDGTILDGKLWSERIAGLDPDRWTELGVKLESVIEDIDDAYTPQFQEFYDALDERPRDGPHQPRRRRARRSRWCSRPTDRRRSAGPSR